MSEISKEDLKELQDISSDVVAMIQARTKGDVGKALFIMTLIYTASEDAYNEYKKRTEDEQE